MKNQLVSVWSTDVFEIMYITDTQHQISDLRRRVWNRHELLTINAVEGKDE